jgi:hypothetical protein
MKLSGNKYGSERCENCSILTVEGREENETLNQIVSKEIEKSLY